MSIGYANICSTVQDHRQSFWYFIRLWKNKRESKEINNIKAWSIWREVLLKWWCHQKQVLVRSISSEAISPEAEVYQEMRDLMLQRLFSGFNLVQHCRRLKECSNDQFERIWKHWMHVLSRALTKDNCTNCTTTSSTTLFVSLQQDSNNSSACRNVPSN